MEGFIHLKNTTFIDQTGFTKKGADTSIMGKGERMKLNKALNLPLITLAGLIIVGLVLYILIFVPKIR